ncbi:Integrase core domain [Popillia japonica]|uniref:Integrase core domain n=1 Tax=Popillia japonica TaxID=7064 RepID=A0AAW1JVQ9_POPJA
MYISRHPTQHAEYKQPKTQTIEEHIKFVATHSIPKAMSVEDVQRASKQDTDLQKVLKVLTKDDDTFWNDLKGYKNISPRLHQKMNVRTKHKPEITSENEVVLRNNRIILLTNLQKRAFELAHRGYLGIVKKTKQLLRSKGRFPKIGKMVELEIKNCSACQIVTPQYTTDSVIGIELPSAPWENLHIDFAGPYPGGKYLLILIDEYTRFLIVEVLSALDTETVTKKWTHIFAMFGLPKRLKSENGPSFSRNNFKVFLDEFNIEHHRITPY